MLADKRLICSYAQGLATPLPISQYALVSRDILCHCHVQAGLTYLLKSIATCNISQVPVLHYQVNLAFWDYFHKFWNNTLTRELTTVEPVFPTCFGGFLQRSHFTLLQGKFYHHTHHPPRPPNYYPA